jgi:hypothetical protein
MTTNTTKEDAQKVLQLLTAEHGSQPYFQKADIVYNDGFFGVDIYVDGDKWRSRVEKKLVPPQINRVPICVLVFG